MVRCRRPLSSSVVVRPLSFVRCPSSVVVVRCPSSVVRCHSRSGPSSLSRPPEWIRLTISTGGGREDMAQDPGGERMIATNRKAFFNYEILDKAEAGGG